MEDRQIYPCQWCRNLAVFEACHCRIHDRLHVQCWGEEDRVQLLSVAPRRACKSRRAMP